MTIPTVEQLAAVEASFELASGKCPKAQRDDLLQTARLYLCRWNVRLNTAARCRSAGRNTLNSAAAHFKKWRARERAAIVEHLQDDRFRQSTFLNPRRAAELSEHGVQVNSDWVRLHGDDESLSSSAARFILAAVDRMTRRHRLRFNESWFEHYQSAARILAIAAQRIPTPAAVDEFATWLEIQRADID